MIHLDTSFVIDLFREVSRAEAGPARKLLDELRGEPVGISVFALSELWVGVHLSAAPETERGRIRSFVSHLTVAYPDEKFPGRYGDVAARLLRKRERVAAMDLLIATTALLAGARLVTRNTRDFSRIPGLDFVTY